MNTHQETAEFSGEAVRNVTGTLVWCAQPLGQSEMLHRKPLASLRTDLNRNELQTAVKELTDSLRKRHDVIVDVGTTFKDRFQKAAEALSPGQEMDPDDIAVPELEKAEAYFHKEREELCRYRDALQRKGGAEAHGIEVFKELDRLERLFKYLIGAFQELRWTIMINDGSLAPNTGGTCTSGSGFMASMEDL